MEKISENKEYKKILKELGPFKEDKRSFYHFVMFGSEGVEGYKVVRDETEMANGDIMAMKLRARFNSHRNIEVHAFKSDVLIPSECITKKFLKSIKTVKLY